MPSQNHALRLLPYPDGKTFAFTIIDDTDGATLESIRPVYEYLDWLGLRTTKTVWAVDPERSPERDCDTGDSLDRPDYANYIRSLQERGFEIALHNVSSQSNRRRRIEIGLDRFRDTFGSYPAINVHHEKSRENLYFDFAQRGHRPPSFQTRAMQSLRNWVAPHEDAPAKHACCGEDSRGEYFWGDWCQALIAYVRSNVFFRELNTLQCNPLLPYSSAETPYVNSWFDSSNGQDVRCFAEILCDRNISRLRAAEGCAILYTHFGMGFVTEKRGAYEMDHESARRLEVVARRPEGWYAPVGEILDRLRALQKVAVHPVGGGILLANLNRFDIASVTLQGEPGATYGVFATGDELTANSAGSVILPSLPAGRTIAIFRLRGATAGMRWNEGRESAWRSDLEYAARKLRERLPHA